jgi:hypothetical protein
MIKIWSNSPTASEEIQACISKLVPYEIVIALDEAAALRLRGVLDATYRGRSERSRLKEFIEAWRCRQNTWLMTYGICSERYAWTYRTEGNMTIITFDVKNSKNAKENG